jgi:hypothetical protein
MEALMPRDYAGCMAFVSSAGEPDRRRRAESIDAADNAPEQQRTAI